MIENISPLIIIVLPAFVVAQLRHRWSFYFALFSIPFYSLVLFSVFGSKRILLPELALMGLAGRQTILLMRTREMTFPDKGLVWYLGFLAIALVSVLSAAIFPADGMVNPYGVGGFADYELSQIALSSATITQLLYRAFTVVAIIAFAMNLTYRRTLVALRWIVYSGIGVGAIGVGYQVARLLQFYTVPEIFRWMGFLGFYNTRGTLGPIPRMYTTAGEPGFTASFLLFGFAIALTSSLFTGQVKILRSREAVTATVVLAVLLILTTSTTAYGGLLILSLVLLVIKYVESGELMRTILQTFGALVVGSGLILGMGFLVFRLDLYPIITRQIEKLMFSAGSGSIRIWYVQQTIPLLLQRPLFGVGVGIHYSPMLLSGIVIETGLFGLFAFAMAHIQVFRNCFARIASSKLPSQPDITVFVGGITLILTLLVAKTITGLRFPWYWLALALPTALNSPSDSPPPQKKESIVTTGPDDGKDLQLT
jgi:O-antigen ligase